MGEGDEFLLPQVFVAQRGLSSEWGDSHVGHILQQLQETPGSVLEWSSVGPVQPHTVPGV